MLKTMTLLENQHEHIQQMELSSPDLHEFQEILYNEENEAFGDVDVEKLRIIAQRGVPDEIRGDVWKFLLVPSSGIRTATSGERDCSHLETMSTTSCSTSVSSSSSCNSSSVASMVSSSRSPRSPGGRLLQSPLDQASLDSYQLKRFRGELERYRRRIKAYPGFGIERLESVEVLIRQYLMKTGLEFSSSLVYLSVPIVYASRNEQDAYLSFEAFMKNLNEHFEKNCIEEQVAHFYSLFRRTMPDLYYYFEEEEVSKECITSWLQYLLARELPLPSLLRLWDCYFSHEDGLQVHKYVCLSILGRFKESLEELENSEIQTFLSRLPVFDMDDLICQAQNLKHEVDHLNIF